VIVVVGSPVGRIVDGRITLTGMAAVTARAAAVAGAEVQLVGRVGDDPGADALLLELAGAGIGHVAVLRDPARPTPVEGESDADGTDDPEPVDAGTEPTLPQHVPIELDPGDVELGLRYLTEFAVLVLEPPASPDVLRVAIEGARWANAALILVVEGETPPDLGSAPDAIVLAAPVDDPDGAFAMVVGRLAAALDAGADPATAFRDVVMTTGWAAATPEA
jgi:hypothetical protein